MPSKPRPIRTLTLMLWLASACAEGRANRGSEGPPAWCSRLPRPENQRLTRVPVETDWFEVYRVAPDVYAIYEPDQFEEVISYLILGTERALLFDTGLGIASIRDVVVRLTPLPVLVLNSHTHPDHIGGNAEFTPVVATDTEFTAANSRGMDHERVAGMLAPEALCRLPAEFDSAAYAIPPFDIDGTVEDGDVIDLGERSLEILLTPGHAPDALMLFDRDHGLLFSGDSFYEGPIYVMTDHSDFDAYRRSIARVSRLVPTLQAVLPGHNVAKSDPGMIAALHEAVVAIAAGAASPAESMDGITTYRFDSFAILVPDSVGSRDP